MPAFRRPLQLWSIWTLAAAFALTANPWGQEGPVEMLAVLSPFLLVLPRRVWREAGLAIGLPLLTLVWLADPADPSVLRLLFAWCVFVGGTLLAARVLESQRELESVVGSVAYADRSSAPDTSDDANRLGDRLAKPLRQDIERELGRARRHDRSFAVLSAAIQPQSIETNSAGLLGSDLMRALAENRARLELHALLRTELHVYCDVAIDDSRVLALIPEVNHDALEFLLERLANAAHESLDFPVQMGAGSFPADAICAEELIVAADRKRTTSKLRSLPERIVVEQETEEPVLRSPDAQA